MPPRLIRSRLAQACVPSARATAPGRLAWWLKMHGRAVARAEGTQAFASLLRFRRAGIALGLAWTVSGRLGSELRAIYSRAVAGLVQPHLRPSTCSIWWLTDACMGGRLHARKERMLRRACCVSGEVAWRWGWHGQCPAA